MSGHQVCHTEPEEGNSAARGRSSEQILDPIIQLAFYMPHTWGVTLCRATRMRWIFTSLSLKFTGFPGDSVGKNLQTSAGDAVSIPGSGRSPGGENGNPLQYSCLENPMDRRAWWATVCRGHKELDMTEET